jgi:hypothetical protein
VILRIAGSAQVDRVLEAHKLNNLGLDLLGHLHLAESLYESPQRADLATSTTVHRRLTRLAKAGLVAHEPGVARAPGRLWSLLHTQETKRLVTTLLALSDAIEDLDRAEHDRTRRHLKRARADRLGFEDTSRRSA